MPKTFGSCHHWPQRLYQPRRVKSCQNFSPRPSRLHVVKNPKVGKSLRENFWLSLFLYFQVIFREDSHSWINVSNIFHVIEQKSNQLEFIVSSEETGYRHLYHVKAALHLQGQAPAEQEEVFRRLRLQPQIVEKTPLTSGDWTVSHNPIGKS